MSTMFFCFSCGKPWVMECEPPKPWPTTGKFVAQCLKCYTKSYRPQRIKTEEERDEEFERDAPEDAFGPHLGSGVRGEQSERVAYFTPRREDKR